MAYTKWQERGGFADPEASPTPDPVNPSSPDSGPLSGPGGPPPRGAGGTTLPWRVGDRGTGGTGGTGGGPGPAPTPEPAEDPFAARPPDLGYAANYATQGGNGGGWNNFASVLSANPLHSGWNKRLNSATGVGDDKSGQMTPTAGMTKWDDAVSNAYGMGGTTGVNVASTATGPIGSPKGQGGPSAPLRAPVVNPETQPVFQLYPSSSITFGMKGR